MGRQLYFVLSTEKEQQFQDFLISKADVCFLTLFSKTKSLNVLPHLPAPSVGNFSFLIWNKSFPFTPEFFEIREEYQKNDSHYFFKTDGKPLIQYNRAVAGTPGRIYWQKSSTSSPIEYDVSQFELWYVLVSNWFKKNCKYSKEKKLYLG